MVIGSGYQPKSGAKAPTETPRGGTAGSKDGAVRYLGDVQRLALKPGDIIVITVDGMISSEQASRLKDNVLATIGGGYKVMVLDSRSKLGVLSPEE